MKRNNNVLSISTVLAVAFSVFMMMVMSIMLISNVSYAAELGDEFGGPGIGISDSTWDGSKGNRIYGYGNINGIVGDIVDEHNAASGGPQNYKVYNDNNPIDPTLIGGPTTANNDAYSLHYIYDGGPGMGVESNELGQTQYYDDGGPGMAFIKQQQVQYQLDNVGPTAYNYSTNINPNTYSSSGMVYGQSGTQYIDKGPIGYDKVADPRNYFKLLNMKPGDFTFKGGSLEDKTR